ncbi:metalloregulator ArsR/SmtB family transcription factor [Thalassotalea sp. ND16A]|uniref:metalloregulator ArsR/SmtB family transcription factor n=1 Tax=Thalassotalea sp. ND16A TaxID=1535422 RepID=UPI00051CF293|nr:metalloregulator ArsR/SmtB family transcription factor [Thalassotalea sp. ND16A]KGJ89329.1 putative transcriptional regulator, ArsR family [Thalassotalea sp. ND16A]
MSIFPVDFFKCLADETRLSIVMLIKQQGELCVCELTTALTISQPKVSRHLAVLKNAGLLTTRKQGQWVYYDLSRDISDWCIVTINSCLAENFTVIENLVMNLNAMGDRPQRLEICCNNSN